MHKIHKLNKMDYIKRQVLIKKKTQINILNLARNNFYLEQIETTN